MGQNPAVSRPLMKIVTFNINGINGRLALLLRWLEKESPDVVCLQELKARTTAFQWCRSANAVWRDLARPDVVERRCDPAEGRDAHRKASWPAGDPNDLHSRYIEADIGEAVVGCLYLPNGNPQPGPKFDYKLEWFERLTHTRPDCWRCAGR
jgi:exodeoxyribonuclease-3